MLSGRFSELGLINALLVTEFDYLYQFERIFV
jgi:hypothetical protein